jgi:glycosyltransferase involved in cell wall biosynthesis
MGLSIIIPAYNEEKRIEKTLKEYWKFFKNKKIDFEIIVVLNACKDNTLKIVKNINKKYKEIKYLNFKQGGKGFAIIEGFKYALKRNNDLIGFVDADMATSPKSFYDLVKNINNYEGIIASRWLKGSLIKKRTLLRTLTSAGFNFLVRSLFLFNYRDTQCGAKLFKRKTIEIVIPKLKLTEWAFDVNLLYLCKINKLKIKEITTIWEDKENSKINNLPKTSFQMFSGVIRLKLIESKIEPLAKQLRFIAKLGNNIINK